MRSSGLSLVLSLCVAAACGGDDDARLDAAAAVDGGADAGAMIDGAPRDGAPVDGAPVDGGAADAAPSVDAAPSIDSAPSVDAAPAPDGAGVGATCGGFAGLMCGESTYCDYGNDICGAADGTGTCTERPMFCPEIYQPVCGCDGAVHDNVCFAYADGTDLNALGGCRPPSPDMFGCGYTFCRTDSSYCRHSVSDVGGIPDDYECVALPAACAGGTDCACLAEEPCGAFCAKAGDGFVLTCPGG